MQRNRKGAQFDKAVFIRLMKYIFSKYKFRFLISAIAIVVSSVSSITSMSIIAKIIDNVITPALKNDIALNYSLLFKYIIIMGSLVGVAIIAVTVSTQIISILTQTILNDFRQQTFAKMEKLPIKFFDTHDHGAIMSTYTNDIDAIRQFISQSLPSFFQSIISAITALVIMLLNSLWLTFLVIFALFFIMQVTKKLGSKSSKYMMGQQIAIAEQEGFVEEMINGQKVIKVFNHEQTALNDFDKLNDKLCNEATKAYIYSNILMPILSNMGNLLYVLLAFVGAILSYYGVINVSLTGVSVVTTGIVILFLNTSKTMSQAINQTSMQLPMIAMATAGMRRVYNLLDEEVEFDEGYVTLVNVLEDSSELIETPNETRRYAWKHPHQDGTVTYKELLGDVVLDNVDFRYDESKLILEDVSIYALPGQKVALVGATGAGKTTITNLINRFYDIEDGKIRYDSININKIKKDDLRRSLGVVLQDVNLFTGTVMDNIRYGKLNATDDECINASILANSDGFIRRLPEGYNTVLTNNGSNLSQGQRQLISIARALVMDPPVLILDEATSSIDTHTEKLVQAGMDNLMKGRTTFVIAHRLSTIKNSDVIMVLDKGKIIERGNHDYLIEKKGTYYSLYTGLFELE